MSIDVKSDAAEANWREIVLRGANVASYKFSLAKAILKFGREGRAFVTLDDLAVPFAAEVAAHLAQCDRQSTSPRSQYLEMCRRFNQGVINHDELVHATRLLGFKYVLDAFHTLPGGAESMRYFEKSGAKGITLTDDAFRLSQSVQAENLDEEVEARWRLVETAWESNFNVAQAVIENERGRSRITSNRAALNGYQQGKCFYCAAAISVRKYEATVCDVDHLIPHSLNKVNTNLDLNGVWNLVLACAYCNRNKRDQLPSATFLPKLHTRNEFLISSHHPLRETLIRGTGATEKDRAGFLEGRFKYASEFLKSGWQPRAAIDP